MIMKLYRLFSLGILAVYVTLSAYAYDFKVDGIYYNVIGDNEVEVTYRNFEYEGDVVIPEFVTNGGVKYKVTQIGEYAFYRCMKMTSIVIPNSVTSIEAVAFYYCDSLTSLVIPNSVKSIEDIAFASCSQLETIILSEQLEKMGNGIFSNCNKLVSITIPSSVKSIGRYAFQSCSSLASVTIQEGITDIGDYSFYYSGLSSVSIPRSVKRIGNRAFQACKLSSIEIPNSVTTIGDYAFSGCSLTSMEIPSSVDSIGTGILSGCSHLKSLIVNTGNKRYDSRGNCNAIIESESNTLISTCLGLKSFSIPDGVTAIGDRAFSGYSSLKSIQIPNGIISIGNYAFSNCDSLEYVELPISLQSIGDYAFSGSPLKEITIPKNVNHIGQPFVSNYEKTLNSIVVDSNNRFFSSENGVLFSKDKSELLCYPSGKKEESYNVPNSVVSIGPSAFSYSKLSKINLPSTIERISDSAFMGCSGLSSIILPNSITSIGRYAFNYCIKLQSICIPEKVKSLESGTFSSCSALEEVFLPEGLVSLGSIAQSNEYMNTGYGVFEGCRNLVSIYLPQGLRVIGDAAFRNCGRLRSISISKNVEVIGRQVLAGDYSLSGIMVEGGNENYYSSDGVLFDSKKNTLLCYPAGKVATSYEIPAGIKGIEECAFDAQDYLESLTLSQSIMYIADYAFDYTNVKSIHSKILKPFPVSFSHYPTTLIVPKGTKEAYMSELGWRTINNIVESSECGEKLDTKMMRDSCESMLSYLEVFYMKMTDGNIIEPTHLRSLDKAIDILKGRINSFIAKVDEYDKSIESGNELSDDLVATIVMDWESSIAGITRKEPYLSDISSGFSKTSFTSHEGGITKVGELSLRNETKTICWFDRYSFYYLGIEPEEILIQPIPDKDYHVNDFYYVDAHNRPVPFELDSVKLYNLPEKIIVEFEKEVPVEIEEDFMVDYIYYHGISSTMTAQVIAVDKGVENIDIPISVVNGSRTYSVTSVADDALAGTFNYISLPSSVTSLNSNSLRQSDIGALIWNANKSLSANVFSNVPFDVSSNFLLYVNAASYAPSNVKNVVVGNTAKAVSLSDAGGQFYCPKEFVAQNITYTHNYSMKTGGNGQGWESIVLPFDVQRISHSTKGEIVPFAAYNANDRSQRPFWLYRFGASGFVRSSSINANTPHIIAMPNNTAYDDEYILAGDVAFSATNVTVKPTSQLSLSRSGGKTFTPAYRKIERSSSVYALNVNNRNASSSGGYDWGSRFIGNLRDVYPFEAYMLVSSAEARDFIEIEFEDEVTGLVGIPMRNDSEMKVAVYSISGQLIMLEKSELLDEKLHCLPSGIDIVDGNKTVVQ